MNASRETLAREMKFIINENFNNMLRDFAVYERTISTLINRREKEDYEEIEELSKEIADKLRKLQNLVNDKMEER